MNEAELKEHARTAKLDGIFNPPQKIKAAQSKKTFVPHGPSRAKSGEKPIVAIPSIDSLLLSGLHFVCEIDGLPLIFFSDSRLGCTAGLNLVYNLHPQTLSTEKLLTEIEISATMVPGKIITKDYNYHNPKYELKHEAKVNDALSTQEQFTIFESVGRFQTDAQGKPFTQYRLDALRAESELGRGEGNCIEVKPGLFHAVSAS